jgi:tRNA(fMet)-specific endonuclease VapC
VIYLLDTNAVIAILKNEPERVQRRLVEVIRAGGEIAVSTIVLFELRYGIARSQRRRANAEQLNAFLAGNILIADFEEIDAPIAGDLRSSLEAVGRPIGPYDLLIAAQSLRIGATLVTANVSEFSRVPNLVWEDWTTAP